MYILTILTVSTHEVKIIDTFSDIITAVSHLHDSVCRTIQSDDSLESQIISSDRIEVYKRNRGYITSSKELMLVFQICNHE